MSRAFVSDKEDWIYCAKAGERCMHAVEGHDCSKTDCEFFAVQVQTPDRKDTGLRIVRRQPKEEKKTAGAGKTAGAVKTAAANKAVAANKAAAAGRTTGTGAKNSGNTRNSGGTKNPGSTKPASGTKRSGSTKKASLGKPRLWGGRSATTTKKTRG